jgi:arylformamidase
MFNLLSFTLTENAPAPGGRAALHIQVDETLDMGKPGNTYYYTAWNHAGTHMDAPGHMLAGGHVATDVDINDLVFTHVVSVDVPKGDDDLVMAKDMEPYASRLADCDLLLLRTGFTQFRSTAPLRYRDHNPGLSVDVAEYLAGPRFPQLRAIGIDAISMAAAAKVEEGIAAHKILFSGRHKSPIYLIEDMNVPASLNDVRRVIVVPLYIMGLDSCPCTILAEL